MRTYNKQIASNVPLNVNYISNFEPLKNIFMLSIAAIITGTPNGTLKLQASNDPETNDTIPLSTPPHWVDVARSSFAVTSAGETMWNISDVAYNYIRVVYIDASGGTSTATMTIIINSKGM